MTSPPSLAVDISAFEWPYAHVTDVQSQVRQEGYGALPEGYYGAWLSPPVECAASLMLHTVVRPGQAIHAAHRPTGEVVFQDGYYPVGLGRVMLIQADIFSEQYLPRLICEPPISPRHMKKAYSRIL